MKKLLLVSIILICGMGLFTVSGACHAPFRKGPSMMMPVDGGGADEPAERHNPLGGDRGFQIESSGLSGLKSIAFDSPDLIDRTVSTIQEYCEENNLSQKMVLSVINNFDEYLQLNAAGAQARSLNSSEESLIKISTAFEAKVLAELMCQLTTELSELQTQDNLVFNENDELQNQNLTIQSYTGPLAEIVKQNPEVKGTILLLGALDFMLKVKDLQNISGYQDTVVALANYAKKYSDFVRGNTRANVVGYLDVIKSLDKSLSQLKLNITITDSERTDFAELIHVATEALRNNRLLLQEDFWNDVLSVAKEQGQYEFRQITDIIKRVYNL